MTNAEDRVSDLLLRWEDCVAQGGTVKPSDVCQDTPELLPELQRRIEAVQALGRLVFPADTPIFSEPTTLSWHPAARIDLAAPVSLPGYEILAELGHGGMGVVYKARDLRFERRLVAIKMIRTDKESNPERLARFRTEAEALARIKHPHIIQIFTVGEHAGEPFLVMEYIEGGSLKDRLNQEPQPIEAAAQLMEVLARAVHAAHLEGIIHRDLKPANVLLAPARDGGPWNTAYGLPKVADFGLARHLTSESGQTLEGVVMGTPGYMSPEQAGGRNREIGPATDIYALGGMLYQLLTGRPPFMGRSPLETVVQICQKPPVPPRQLRPDIPGGLEAICLRCLEKSPTNRYASALDLANDLGRFRNAEARAAPRKPSLIRPRWQWLTAAAALLLVVALEAMVFWPRHPVANSMAEKPPLEGDIRGLVWRPHHPDAPNVRNDDPQWLRLEMQEAVPLRRGDRVRFEMRLNHPAFLYVVWIDTEGRSTPLYPWRDTDWQRRPKREEPCDRLSEPRDDAGMTQLEPGPPGVETLLLLAREEPLTDAEHATLVELLSKPQVRRPMPDLAIAVWPENGERGADRRDRGPPSPLKTRESGDPELQIRGLMRRLREWFPYSRALCFGNLGKN
jgi:serine/threonine protein kinase